MFPIGGIRSRAIELADYRDRRRQGRRRVRALTVKMGAGRDATTKKRAFDALFDTVKAHFAVLFERRNLALSMEVGEFDEGGTYKHNNIHRVSRKAMNMLDAATIDRAPTFRTDSGRTAPILSHDMTSLCSIQRWSIKSQRTQGMRHEESASRRALCSSRRRSTTGLGVCSTTALSDRYAAAALRRPRGCAPDAMQQLPGDGLHIGHLNSLKTACPRSVRSATNDIGRLAAVRRRHRQLQLLARHDVAALLRPHRARHRIDRRSRGQLGARLGQRRGVRLHHPQSAGEALTGGDR